MRVAFFGLPLAALLLLRDGHEIVYAGVCRKAAIGTRRLRRALPGRVEIVPNLDIAKTQARIRDAGAELCVSWYWTKNIPKALRETFPLGTVGVHPSLLPRHRGSDPFFGAIDSGDTETGVTAHRLEDEYDTGAMLGKRALCIDPSWSAWTLAKKLDRPSLALLRDVTTAFARGCPPHEEAQDEQKATLANAPEEDDLELDWTWSAERIVRRVRAASPWPGVFTFIGDRAVTITRAALTTEIPKALLPGEATVLANGTAAVRAGDSGVQLLAGRMEAAKAGEDGDAGGDAKADAKAGARDDEVSLGERDLSEIVANAIALP